jgi:hypothetical protein
MVPWLRAAFAGAATRDIGSIGGSSAAIANGSGYGMAAFAKLVASPGAGGALFPSIIGVRLFPRTATLLLSAAVAMFASIACAWS